MTEKMTKKDDWKEEILVEIAPGLIGLTIGLALIMGLLIPFIEISKTIQGDFEKVMYSMVLVMFMFRVFVFIGMDFVENFTCRFQRSMRIAKAAKDTRAAKAARDAKAEKNT